MPAADAVAKTEVFRRKIVKAILKSLAAFGAAALLAGCASAPAPGTTVNNAPKKLPKFEVINHKGAELGQEVPEWVMLDESEIESSAASGDANFARYKDKVLVKVDRTGANLTGVKRLAENMDAAPQIAKMISLRVQNLFAGSEIGDDKNVETYFENVTKNMAEATITGFKKEGDYWTLLKYLETDKEEYHYYVLYSIPTKTLEKLMNDALGQETPETPEKQTAKDRVKALMNSSLPSLSSDQRGL